MALLIEIHGVLATEQECSLHIHTEILTGIKFITNSKPGFFITRRGCNQNNLLFRDSNTLKREKSPKKVRGFSPCRYN